MRSPLSVARPRRSQGHRSSLALRISSCAFEGKAMQRDPSLLTWPGPLERDPDYLEHGLAARRP